MALAALGSDALPRVYHATSSLANASTQLSQERRASGPIPMSLPPAAPPYRLPAYRAGLLTCELISHH